MGYTHKDSSRPRHRWAKMTNLQNAIDLHDTAFNGEPSRFLSNWEWAELREICEAQAIPEPTERTLSAFVAIAGRNPTYWENGQWITPLKESHEPA